MSTVVMVSGGPDSLISWVMESEKTGSPVPWMYVPSSADPEGAMTAQEKALEELKARIAAFNASQVDIGFNSPWLQFEDKDTWEVKGRNFMFAWVAANYGYTDIILSIQKGEMAAPDRTPEFLLEASSILSRMFSKDITVRSNVGHLDKRQMVQWLHNGPNYNYAIDAKNSLHLTRSCYRGGALHCGSCPACVRRFISMWGVDKTEYYSRPEDCLEFADTALGKKGSEDRIRYARDIMESMNRSVAEDDGFFLGARDIEVYAGGSANSFWLRRTVVVICSGEFERLEALIDSLVKVEYECIPNITVFFNRRHNIRAGEFKSKVLQFMETKSEYITLAYLSNDPITLPDCRNYVIDELVETAVPDVLFLDCDTVVDEKFMDILDEVTSPLACVVNGYPVYSSDRSGNRQTEISIISTDRLTDCEYPCISGNFMYAKMEVFRDYGIRFDNQFHFWCEDFDFSLSVYHATGKMPQLVSCNVVTHHKHGSQMFSNLIYTPKAIALARERLYSKWEKVLKDLKLVE